MTGAGNPGRILVVPATGDRRRGTLKAGPLLVPCALGRSGVTHRKHEGDGATPVGRHRLVALLYRADRVPRPATRLPASPIEPDSGWCDDPRHPAYNRPVHLPFPAGHERLWRDDSFYDLLVVLDFNLERPRRGGGSAIFLHIARPDFAPTEGCIAIAPAAMRRLLAVSGPATVIEIR